jgi:hypothetical protein
VTVTIPVYAGGTSDEVTITAASETNPYVTDTLPLVTRAYLHALTGTISPAAQTGKRGETLQYTVTITNTGDLADTFTITPSSAWALTNLPTATNPLTPGQKQTFTFGVLLPVSGPALENSVTLSFQPQAYPSVTVLTLQATAKIEYRVYLPLVIR